MGPHQRRDADDIDSSVPFVGEARDADACIGLAVGVCAQVHLSLGLVNAADPSRIGIVSGNETEKAVVNAPIEQGR